MSGPSSQNTPDSDAESRYRPTPAAPGGGRDQPTPAATGREVPRWPPARPTHHPRPRTPTPPAPEAELGRRPESGDPLAQLPAVGSQRRPRRRRQPGPKSPVRAAAGPGLWGAEAIDRRGLAISSSARAGPALPVHRRRGVDGLPERPTQREPVRGVHLEGSGESDAASGRGWAALEETGRCVDTTRRVHKCVHAARRYSCTSPPSRSRRWAWTG